MSPDADVSAWRSMGWRDSKGLPLIGPTRRHVHQTRNAEAAWKGSVDCRLDERLINTTVSNGVSAADLLTVEATPQTIDTQDMRNASKRYAEVGAPAFRDRLQFKDR